MNVLMLATWVLASAIPGSGCGWTGLVLAPPDVEVHGQTAIIRGPTPLVGAEVSALDLRAGAAVTLAGLVADGETIVRRANQIERGYTNFAANIVALGGACETASVEVTPPEPL